MKTTHIPTTATAVEKLRKEAKALVKSSGHRLHQCLDAVAAQAGYQHWKHVTECLEVTNSDQKPVRWNQLIHTPSSEGKSFAAVSSSAAPTPATVEQLDPGQQYLDGIALRGLAAVVRGKPARAIFHDVVIEGRRFAAVMADDIYLCRFDGSGNQVGSCPLGAARIKGTVVSKFRGEESFWSVGIAGLSDPGVRALMVEFGIAQDDYRGPLPLLFYASKAFESLVEWSKRHPKLSREYGQAGQYLRHWWRKVKDASKDKDVPPIETALALNGRSFATLNEREASVLSFYLAQGRKYNIGISIISDADPQELEEAKTQQQADEIIRRANGVVAVSRTNGWAPSLEAEVRALSNKHRLSLLDQQNVSGRSVPFAQALRELSGVHARLANQPGAPDFTFVVKPRRGVVQALELPGSADVFKQALGIESPEGEDNAPGRSERPRG